MRCLPLFVPSFSQGAAVVTRWECFDVPPPPQQGGAAKAAGAAGEVKGAHALSTCHVLETEPPAAPAPAPAPPGSAARLTLPAATLKPLSSPLSLSLGGAAAGTAGRASTLSVPQLGGGGSRLVLPQLGGGAAARPAAPVAAAAGAPPRPLTLGLPQLGSGAGGPVRSSGSSTLVVPTLGAAPRPLTLPSLPAPSSPARAPAPAAAPARTPSKTTLHPAPERQWRCVQWTVAARSPVPAMALSPDGSQLALGTSAGEVVVLAPTSSLRRAWATRPIHGFPVTGVAFLPRAGCVVSGSADAHVAFTPLRPVKHRNCCGLLVTLALWTALFLFSVSLSAGGMAALAIAVSQVSGSVPRADLPLHQRLLAEVDRATAGQLGVIGRGLAHWLAEGSPSLLAQQLQEAAASPTWWPTAVAEGAAGIQDAAEGSYSVTRDQMGNWVRVFFPQGEGRPYNAEAEAAKAAAAEREAAAKAAAEAEAAAAAAARRAAEERAPRLGAAPGGLPEGPEPDAAAAAAAVDAETGVVSAPAPPPTPEEEEQARIAAAAAAARASIFFDHSDQTRLGQQSVPVLVYDRHGRVVPPA